MTNAPTRSNEEQIQYWNEVGGPKWVHYQAMLDRQLEAIGAATMDAAEIVAGESVLDVGCGCGSSTLALAHRVGPAGRCTGIDISGPMLDVARSRARAENLANVSFEQADAQVHPFRAEYDVLYSRFGVMFFEEPTLAFANLHRAMRRGGRVAFVCWQALHKNPWMSVPLMAAFQHVTIEPPPRPDAPGPFAFADAGHIAAILTGAGFSDIGICGHDIELSVGGGADLDSTVDFLLDMGPLGRVLVHETADVKAAVARDVRAAVAGHTGAEGLKMPAAAWIVTANA